MARRHGFTVIEALVLVVVVGLAATLCVAANDQEKRTRQQIQNSTQLRGIHQSLVIFAQSNKTGSSEGYFPGIDPRGKIIAKEHGPKYKELMEDNYFVPEYAINPVDKDKKPWDERGDVTTLHYSYSMLDVRDAEKDKGRHQEWRETINTAAIVLSDRNTKSGKERGSLWTDADPEQEGWRGTAVRNDNSTSFEASPVFKDTKYGEGERHKEDDLFDKAGAFDAFLTYGKPAKANLALR